MRSTHSASRGALAEVLHDLARFRYGLRQFLRFSERAARAAGVTPLQHQLMLGVAGFTGRGWATVSELAECLQERHNAVVALVDRAVRLGLVRREKSDHDRRIVRVELTPKAQRILTKLTRLHHQELAKFKGGRWQATPADRRRAVASGRRD